jgi:predicted DNA binding CopG/RHH family protein
MSKKAKIEANDESWDSGKLGRDENHVRVSDGVDEQSIDASVGLVAISIRLQESLVNDFKMIAKLNGIGYQPLMRQILTRFADCEKKKIIQDMLAEENKSKNTDGDPDDPERKRA